MPYSSLSKANSAIRGIKPSVTLAQAYMIAEWADTMAASTSKNKPDNPWATAVSQFKKLHTVADGKWVRKAQEAKSQEAFKTIDGKKRPASDFLVVPDRNEPGGWALPVKVNGRIDHKLMTEAWEYEGPDRAKAISKLRALYKREGLAEPTEENMIKFVRDPQFTEAVIIEKDGKFYHAPFKDETLAPLGEWREVVREWVFVEIAEVDFAESASGAAVSLREAEATEAEPLVMNVCLIQPGWGNAKDMNYYPKEMLKRDAKKFIGAHQFEKDHTNDKTSRDYVSTITGIVGETPEGGPIARVVVHDPNFAERMKLLDKAGLLKEMPCSILAAGIATEFELDGKKGNQVESITKVHAVDWVTAAGAGGHALAISENNEEASMDEEKQVTEDVEEVQASEDTTEVVLAEDDAEPEAIKPEQVKPAADGDETPVEDDEDKRGDEVEQLSGEAVGEALEASGLPAAAQAKLKEATYVGDELAEVIKAEKAYISDITEAGKPFGHSASKPKGKVSMEEVVRRQDAANARALGTRVREVNDD